MSNPRGIIVFGANGCGKTALGRELARVLGFKHMDVEDYCFRDSVIPYAEERPRDECLQLMIADIHKYRSFVISAVTGDFGEEITSAYDLAVFMTAPVDIRMERIEQREYERHGGRVREGGDMYARHREFVRFAAARPPGPIERWAQAIDCPVVNVDGTADNRHTALELAGRYYTKPGEPWRVYTAGTGELKIYRYTVVFARRISEWLYARQKGRDTFETAGGHIEKGETPLECAKRELYEETGAVKFYIHPAFDYAVHTDTSFAYGQAFFADVESVGDIPPGSEMAEVREFHTIPEKMTYPAILPVLYTEMYKWLGLDKAESEYWDILDENRNKTGRLHKRSEKMAPGDYHLVVRAWIVNRKGEFLITRRAFNKIGFPGMWEIPSGSASAGEGSLEAAIRETREECGVNLSPCAAELFSTYRRTRVFYDNWLFRYEFSMSDVALQEGETIEARAAAWDIISQMMDEGEFISRDIFSEFDLLKNIGV